MYSKTLIFFRQQCLKLPKISDCIHVFMDFANTVFVDKIYKVYYNSIQNWGIYGLKDNSNILHRKEAHGKYKTLHRGQRPFPL